jgi:hypothetical protein
LPDNARPPLEMNADLMKQFIPAMQQHYVNEAK